MTKKSSFADTLLKNTEKINELHKAIHHTVKNRDNDRQTWLDAVQAFRESYDALAFPGGLSVAVELLHKHDHDAISKVIEYLEVDPYYDMSGYHKEKFAHFLKKAPLTDDQKKQLQEVLITSLKKNKRERHFREYCRLAHVITDAAFSVRLQTIIAESPDSQIAQAAQLMLDAIMKK